MIDLHRFGYWEEDNYHHNQVLPGPAINDVLARRVIDALTTYDRT